MPLDSSIQQPPAQGGCCSIQRIDFPAHAQQRMLERGGDRRLIQDRIRAALKQYANLRGAFALTARNPIIVAEFRATRVCIKTLLKPGMPLKRGTRIVRV